MLKKTIILVLFTITTMILVSQAPAFTVETIQGETIRSEALLEKGPIYLDFWSTSCVPCKSKQPFISEFVTKYPDMTFLAVSTDGPRHRDAVVRHVRSNRYSFITGLDSNRNLQRMFNVSSIPRSLIINQNGEIVYDNTGFQAGDEVKIEAEIRAVLGLAE